MEVEFERHARRRGNTIHDRVPEFDAPVMLLHGSEVGDGEHICPELGNIEDDHTPKVAYVGESDVTTGCGDGMPEDVNEDFRR